MNEISCPRCAQLNKQADVRCAQCGARLDEAFVDCHACKATGRIALSYTADYAEETAAEARCLPCARCDGTGRVPLELLRSEIMKRTALELIEVLNLI